MKTHSRAALAVICACITGFPAGATGAADPAVTLRAVTALPASSAYTRGFLAFVHDFNERGKKKIRIELVNSADGTSPSPQLDAIRDGRLDMGFGPVTAHHQWVPEANAISASEIKAKELRANGGMALIDQIYRVRAKVRFLGMLNSGARLHIYLKAAPRMAGNLPNLADTRMAADEMYGGFLATLGAKPASMGFPAALAALRTNKVQGIIWPRVGLRATFRAKQLKYRIDPGFSQIVTGVVINLERWARLDRKARELLDKTMVEHERKSYTAMRVETGKADEDLDMAGLSVISIKGKDGDAYTARATHDAWSALKKNHPGYAAQLEHVFYRERSPK
jgi:TRAP-type transport system periplasmic protein